MLGIIGTGGGVLEGISLHGFEPGEGVGDGDLNGLGDGDTKGEGLGEGERGEVGEKSLGGGDIREGEGKLLGEDRWEGVLKSDVNLEGDGVVDNILGLNMLGLAGDLPEG